MPILTLFTHQYKNLLTLLAVGKDNTVSVSVMGWIWNVPKSSCVNDLVPNVKWDSGEVIGS